MATDDQRETPDGGDEDIEQPPTKAVVHTVNRKVSNKPLVGVCQEVADIQTLSVSRSMRALRVVEKHPEERGMLVKPPVNGVSGGPTGEHHQGLSEASLFRR